MDTSKLRNILSLFLYKFTIVGIFCENEVDLCPISEFCMKICRIILIESLQMKIVRLLIYTVSIYLIFFYAFQTFVFFYKFELHYVIQYGPCHFFTLYILCSCLCLSFVSNILISSEEDLDTWKHTSTNPTIVRKNRRDSIKSTTYVIANWISGVIMAISFILPSNTDEDFIYFLRLSKDFFSDFEYILTTMFKCALIPYGIIAVMVPCQYLIVIVLHLQCQVNILLGNIVNIDTGYEDMEVLDPRIQDVIKERLLFCIKHHLHFFRSAVPTLRQIGKIILPFHLLGIAVFASIVTLSFTVERNILEEWSLRIFCTTLTAFFTLAGLAQAGQRMENISDDIFDSLLQVQWYKWNTANRKLYLMFLLNVKRTHKMKYSENISLNYNMGIQITKSFFSTMSIVYSLQHQ